MEERYEKRSKTWLSNAIYYIASLLMPSILLFDLYNRNHGRNQFVYSQVLILAGALAVVGVLLFVAFRWITRSKEGALLLIILSWLSFWLYEWLFGVMGRILPFFLPSRVFALLLLIIIATITIVFRKTKLPFDKISSGFNMLAFCVIVFFVLNFAPSVNHELTLSRARAELERLEHSERQFYIKRDFYVDSSLLSPDVYWFHMDGLMSLETVERFWGEDYADFRGELLNRGFIIYENAEINGGFTRAAMPALLSPEFYDTFWREQLAKTETVLNPARPIRLLHEVLPEAGIDDYYDVAPYFELLIAFFARGYEMNINTDYEYLPRTFEHIIGEVQESGMWERFLRSDLPMLLSITTPLPMIYHESMEEDVTGITHLRNDEPVATFTWVESMDAHMGESELIREMVELEEYQSDLIRQKRYDLYPYAFEYTFWKMINEIDVILERNPYAVIVLQGDHGFHLDDTQAHLVDQGYSLEQVLELIHSVFSAVRIPQEYGGLEAPIAPVNITRELVNRFVGENYELILQ